MTRFTALMIMLCLVLGLCTAAFGQISQQEAAAAAGSSILANNTPTPYLVSDTSFRVPPLSILPGTERPAYGEIQNLFAVTTNVDTIIRVQYKPGTDSQRMGAVLYIDSDGNAATGSGVGYWPGQKPVNDFGYDFEIQAGWYGTSVRRQGYDCCLQGYAEVIDRDSVSITVKISNRLFAEEGRVLNMRFQANLYDTNTGIPLSVAPANGVASIPATAIITLSPASTKLYKIGPEDTNFNLVADIATIVPEQQVTLYVKINGVNFTPTIVANAKTGSKNVNQARVGGPNYFNFTKRFSYPIESIIKGGGRVKIEYAILTSEGFAFDTVEYTAEAITEAAR